MDRRRYRPGTYLFHPSTSLRASLAALIVATTLTGAAQSPAPAVPRFEVASIKRNVSTDAAGYVRLEEGARFNAVNASLALIIRQAYGVQPFQVLNLPDWVSTERYDIRAKAPDGVEVFPNMAPLLRALLQERFNFLARTQQRELPVYDLVLARSDRRLGPKVTRASFDCGARTTGTPPNGPSGEELCGLTGGPGRITMRGYSMTRFGQSLINQVQRVVVDKTGLTGPWNLEVVFTPEQPAALNGGVVPPNPDGPSLFTAVQEQLGLKLEASRGLVDVLVVDRIEPPTED
jgi:uncharacterized protein (TIGR03435 family)